MGKLRAAGAKGDPPCLSCPKVTFEPEYDLDPYVAWAVSAWADFRRWRVLPKAGGTEDQPRKMMLVWAFCEEFFEEVRKREEKRRAQKMKRDAAHAKARR